MIVLIAAMLRARRLQNLIVALLATITIGAAVAIPALIAASDNAIVTNEIANASNSELLADAVNAFQVQPDTPPSQTFALRAPGVMAMPGFTVTYTDETDVAVGQAVTVYPQLQFQQDECDHIRMLSGRCPVGSAEIAVPRSLATQQKLVVGRSIDLRYALFAPKGDGWSAVPSARPLAVVIVGVYAPIAPTEPYWGLSSPFVPQGDRGVDAPILSSAGTVSAIDHDSETQLVTSVISPASLTSAASLSDDQLDAISRTVRSKVHAVQTDGVIGGSEIPALITAIEQDRASLRVAAPIAAIPLIVLGCFVVFLASGYAVAGRREELGVVALRGARILPRWWLGTGELFLSLLAAIPCGYLLGYATAWLAARYMLPGKPPIGLDGPGMRSYVLLTLAGCVLAILVAAYRTLATRTADLLRNVPARINGWRTATVETIVVALAVTAIVQMRSERHALSGIELVAPGLLLAAIAVVLARLVQPAARWYGARGVRTGGRSLGSAIGALQIARRPGVARVFVLLVVAVGLVTFATFSISISAAARSERAAAELGAPEVVSVSAESRFDLMNAVDKVDPHGTFAMAAADIPQPNNSEPPIIAVDASRLATVGMWPATDTMTAADAARLLKPSGDRKPLIFTGEQISVTISMDTADADTYHPLIAVEAQPLSGTPTQEIDFPDAVLEGTHTYVGESPYCLNGCRFAGLTLFANSFAPDGVTLTVKSFNVTLPTPTTVTTFSSAAQWRYIQGSKNLYSVGRATYAADGLTIKPVQGYNGTSVQIGPIDSPYPVPVISTAKLDHSLQGKLGDDDELIKMASAGVAPTLPRVATNGILVDLTNVDRTVPSPGDGVVNPQVWLNDRAPADVLNRLRAAGLTVLSVARIDDRRTYYDRQGPGLGSHLAVIVIVGVIALLLGVIVLTASVDRTRRGEELWALRVQGLSTGRVRAAARIGYSGLAVAALVAGVVAGVVTWRIAGPYMPVFVSGDSAVPLPSWPQWTTMLWSGLAVAAVLLVASGAASRDLRRVVRRGSTTTA